MERICSSKDWIFFCWMAILGKINTRWVLFILVLYRKHVILISSMEISCLWKTPKNKVWFMLFFAISWYLWLLQNELLFNHNQPNYDITFLPILIKLCVSQNFILWFSLLLLFNHTRFNYDIIFLMILIRLCVD
jgi:hypothetical protein